MIESRSQLSAWASIMSESHVVTNVRSVLSRFNACRLAGINVRYLETVSTQYALCTARNTAPSDSRSAVTGKLTLIGRNACADIEEATLKTYDAIQLIHWQEAYNETVWPTSRKLSRWHCTVAYCSLVVGTVALLVMLSASATFADFYPNVTTLRSGLCCRNSVCLCVTLVHLTQGVVAFGNISSPLCTLAILWPSCKILRRSS